MSSNEKLPSIYSNPNNGTNMSMTRKTLNSGCESNLVMFKDHIKWKYNFSINFPILKLKKSIENKYFQNRKMSEG